MKLYHPIQLNCWNLIQKRTREQTEKLSELTNHTKRIMLSKTEQIMVNQELQKLGLPNFRALLAFKRVWPKYQPTPRNLHVDWFEGDEINKISIVFPVDNCQGTAQFWYDGDYILHKEIVGTDSIIAYFNVIEKKLELLDQVEICDTPMIVSTALPHSAYSGDNYRLTCTMRFEKNIDSTVVGIKAKKYIL